MYSTIFRILLASLGAAHPLVKRMKSKIDDAANKDKKVIDFPSVDVEGDQPNPLFRDLNIEAANENQLKQVPKDLEKIIDLGPKAFEKLDMNKQGNVFRNVKRFERRLKQTPDESGIITLQKPSAPVLKLETGKEIVGEGLKGIQDDLGIPSDIDGKSGIGQLMLKTKRVVKEGDDLAKEFGMNGDLKAGIKSLGALQDEAEVRGVARALITDDIKSGKLKNLSPGMKEGMLNPTGSGLDGDPIDVIYRYYDPGTLEVLEMLVEKHGATPDGIDLIKLDLKNKVGIQDSFEFKPLRFPQPSQGTRKAKIPLTQNEVVEFFTGVDKEGNPISQDKLEFYNRNIDLADDAADTQNYLKRFTDDQGGQQEFLKNLPSKIDSGSVLSRRENKLTPEQIEQLKFKSQEKKPSVPMRLIQDFDKEITFDGLIQEGYNAEQADAMVKARAKLIQGEELNPNEALLRVKEETADFQGIDVDEVDVDLEIDTPEFDPDDSVEAPGLPNIMGV